MANIANLITKLTGIIASLDDIRDAISQGGGGSSTASGVTVTPVAPLTGTNLQATTNETAALLQEHTDEISTLNSSLNNYIRTAEYILNISTTANEPFSANIDATMQGYTLLGVVGIMLLSGASYVYRLNAVPYNGENNIYVSGYSIGAVTIQVNVVALYKKS